MRAQWFSDVVVERFHDRSYKIISEKGRIICRNRVDLKVYHKEVSIKFEDPRDQPTSPKESPSLTQKPTNIQTADRHNQKRHLTSSHSSQSNSSNFSKSHKQTKSSAQPIPMDHHNHDNSIRKQRKNHLSSASPSPSYRKISQNVSQNDSQPKPPIPSISLKRSSSSSGNYHIVSRDANHQTKQSEIY